MTDTSKPRDWFPGVHTGPRVAVAVSADEMATVRAMIDDVPRYLGHVNETARAVMRDLDVRFGALRELTGRAREVPLQPNELVILRATFEAYHRERGALQANPTYSALFVELDRRLGAAQIKAVESGEMDLPGRDDFCDPVDLGDDFFDLPPAPPQPLVPQPRRRLRWRGLFGNN